MIKRFATLCLILLFAAAAFILYRKWRDRPLPTKLGWTAVVSVQAGDGTPTYRDDLSARRAGFADPFGVVVGSDGSIYVSDAGESNRIRRIAADGAVTTLAGSGDGFSNDSAASAAFSTPSGIAIDEDDNIYVADTSNNSIRKVTPDGVVTTLAGMREAGYLDGPAAQARFDAPVGVAVDERGNVYVADTYNDRIRLISREGNVTTIAGAGRPGYADGRAHEVLFDTPCGLAVSSDGSLIVADTGNNLLRRVAQDGQVTTITTNFSHDENSGQLSRPVGLAATHDGFLYVTELEKSRVIQVAPDGTANVIAGSGPGFAEGDGQSVARFNQPTGIAVTRRGELFVVDSGNYLVRKLAVPVAELRAESLAPPDSLPLLTPDTLTQHELLWPLDPQNQPHEVVATLGEVRGSYDSSDSRHHLHSGLDIFGGYGETVRAVRTEKVTSPIANWGFGGLNEGMRVGVISYIHLHVGRDESAVMLDDARFMPVRGDDGKVSRVRMRRGTRFRIGDALGTINRMYHIHMNVGPPGAEVNPLALGPVGFKDTLAPQIEPDGIHLLDEAGVRLKEKSDGRLLVKGRVKIVVDAFDRTDGNSSRRRLGIYRAGYMVLDGNGREAPGFEKPRINLEFNRLPPNAEATKLAYAAESGITVYGSNATRFLYDVTNTIRDGRATAGLWDTTQLRPGDYTLRIIASDYNGNEADKGRDLLIRVAER
jgi:sugar lactone lactonase YvrE